MSAPPTADGRAARIRLRALELCDAKLIAPDVLALARACWLESQETAMQQPSKEVLIAFAEELFGARHPGAPRATGGD